MTLLCSFLIFRSEEAPKPTIRLNNPWLQYVVSSLPCKQFQATSNKETHPRAVATIICFRCSGLQPLYAVLWDLLQFLSQKFASGEAQPPAPSTPLGCRCSPQTQEEVVEPWGYCTDERCADGGRGVLGRHRVGYGRSLPQPHDVWMGRACPRQRNSRRKQDPEADRGDGGRDREDPGGRREELGEPGLRKERAVRELTGGGGP